jgi:hypothetical protein
LKILSNESVRLKYQLAVSLCLILAGALVLIFALPALASSGPQEWYLDGLGSPVSGKIMTRTYNSVSGDLIVASRATQIWLADQAAGIPVSFPDGSWIIQLKTDTYWGDNVSNKCAMAIGEWDTSTSSFIPFSTSTVDSLTYDNGTHILRVEFQMAVQTVYKDNYLALRIENQDTVNHIVYTDGQSSLKSPDSDPGYPDPDVHPDSAMTLISIPGEIYPGGYVTLIVTDTNTGNVLITNPSAAIFGVPGTLNMTLTRASASFTGGDTNNDGIFDVNETWCWTINSVRVNETTVFTSTGFGTDPLGTEITPPAYPGEKAQVTVKAVPLAPAVSGFGIILLIVGLAVSMVMLNSCRTRQH